jgi:RNA polymerase sigma-70 factor, ECF subfamily
MQLASTKNAFAGVPDAELVRRVGVGDREALAVMMRRHNQVLYRTARSILRDDAEAEDAVQEAYLLAYRSLDGFRGDARLSTWLVRIVANESIGRLRKRRRSAEVIRMDGDTLSSSDKMEVSMVEDKSEQPERAAMRAQARRLLERAIDGLPDAFRTVFVLRAVEEMSVEETAAALDVPEATVRTRYFRARGLLREALAREMDFALEDAFSFAGDRCDRIVAGVLARLDDEARARGA